MSVPWIILIVAIVGAAVMAAAGITGYLLAHPYQFKALGMRINCSPKTLVPKINQADMAAQLQAYANQMAVPLGLKPSDILSQFSKIRCTCQVGYLDQLVKKLYNITDTNHDGISDSITGFTQSETETVVAVVDGKMYDPAGMIDIRKTAFMYETHNAIIQHFKGFNVVMAESFIQPTDTIIQGKLGVDQVGLTKLLAERKVYDTAFNAIRF